MTPAPAPAPPDDGRCPRCGCPRGGRATIPVLGIVLMGAAYGLGLIGEASHSAAKHAASQADRAAIKARADEAAEERRQNRAIIDRLAARMDALEGARRAGVTPGGARP